MLIAVGMFGFHSFPEKYQTETKDADIKNNDNGKRDFLSDRSRENTAMKNDFSGGAQASRFSLIP